MNTQTFFWQFGEHSYSWSMMIGFLTFSIVMSLKLISVAAPGYLSGHDLILRPFVVPTNVQVWTLMPFTSISSGYFPRLPILSYRHRNSKQINYQYFML